MVKVNSSGLVTGKSGGTSIIKVSYGRLIIAESETYDVGLTIPQDGTAYEFMATTEDHTNSLSYFIGYGVKQHLSPLPR